MSDGLSWEAISVMIAVMAGVVVPVLIAVVSPLVVVLWKLNGKVEALIVSINGLVKQHEDDRSEHNKMWIKHDRHEQHITQLCGRVDHVEAAIKGLE